MIWNELRNLKEGPEVEDRGGEGGVEENEELGEKTEEAQVAVATPDTQQDDPEDTKTLLVDGLKIMFMDVTIQCCISLSIYLAVTKDGAVGYQLAAMQAALPTYGFAYALGTFRCYSNHEDSRDLVRQRYDVVADSLITRFCALVSLLLRYGHCVQDCRTASHRWQTNQDVCCFVTYDNFVCCPSRAVDCRLGHTVHHGLVVRLRRECMRVRERQFVCPLLHPRVRSELCGRRFHSLVHV